MREASQLAASEEPLTAFLVTLGDVARAAGVGLLQRLRAAGIRADADFVGRSVRAQMREADRQKAHSTRLLVGDNELSRRHGSPSRIWGRQSKQESLSLGKRRSRDCAK